MAHPDRPTWTDAENEVLRQHYATTPSEKLVTLLPRRNAQGIRQQATRLKLTHNKAAPGAWSDEHMAILREHYPTKGAAYVAARVGRSVNRVTGHAHAHLIRFEGVRNPKRKTHKQYPEKKAVGRPRKEPALPSPKPAKALREAPVPKALPAPGLQAGIRTPNLNAQKAALAAARKAVAEQKALDAVVPAAELARLPYTHPARMAYMLNAKDGGAAANRAYHQAMNELKQAA